MAPFTKPERDLLRRELCRHFGEAPVIADGFIASLGQIDALAAVAEPVRLSFLWRPLLPDPDDDMVLEAAVNGRADAIATFNRRDFTEAQRFRIAVRTPGDCLQELPP